MDIFVARRIIAGELGGTSLKMTLHCGQEDKYVRFFNETTLADVTDANIDIFLINDKDEVSSLTICRTFLLSGRLWVDCAPELNRKYTAPVPENVLISRNEDCLTLGRFGLFVPVGSELGNLVAELLDARKLSAHHDSE